ncbi:hypothetical protein [Pseudomonas phage PA7]|uniref:Uncharacterized protein n=1 Tax=Pseudomonas phage PA7 TaxID=347330 RepID=A0AAE7S565_9CAUD|nr:hypothetical protein [Pseudomonas phage PA7]
MSDINSTNVTDELVPYFPSADVITSSTIRDEVIPNILLFYKNAFSDFQHVSNITGTNQIASGYLPGVGYYFEYSVTGNANLIPPEAIKVLRNVITKNGYKDDITITPKGFGLINWFIVRVYVDEQIKKTTQ